MITIGAQDINSMFIGDMGIYAAYIGDKKIYERTGSFIYLRLQSSAQGEQTDQNTNSIKE